MTKRTLWLAGLVFLVPSLCPVAGQTSPPPASPSAQKPPAGEVSIHQAAMQGDLAAVKKLLEQNPALLEARDEDEGVTPLAYAAGFGRMEVLEFLVARGANVNARDPRGLSALHLTVYTGQLQALRYLLDKGADVKSPGPSGMGPLHFAARQRAEIAGLLVERKADVGARDDYGNTALILAVREGAQEVVRVLVDAGADPNAANPLTGDGPLDVALQEGRAGIADYLRSKGAKPRADAPKLAQGTVPWPEAAGLDAGRLRAQRGLDRRRRAELGLLPGRSRVLLHAPAPSVGRSRGERRVGQAAKACRRRQLQHGGHVRSRRRHAHVPLLRAAARRPGRTEEGPRHLGGDSHGTGAGANPRTSARP